MIKDAILNRSSFNLVHLETAVKVDIFIHKNSPHQNSALGRKQTDTFTDEAVKTVFYFSSPEDIIVSKLILFDKGGRVSERQWLDITGVIKVQGDLLDKDYLKTWSAALRITGLLEKAFDDAGIDL